MKCSGEQKQYIRVWRGGKKDWTKNENTFSHYLISVVSAGLSSPLFSSQLQTLLPWPCMCSFDLGQVSHNPVSLWVGILILEMTHNPSKTTQNLSVDFPYLMLSKTGVAFPFPTGFQKANTWPSYLPVTMSQASRGKLREKQPTHSKKLQ